MLQVYHFLSAGMEEKSNKAEEKSRVDELIPTLPRIVSYNPE
jgi:hypothetical protein